MDVTDAVQPFPELPFEIVSVIIEEMLAIEPKRAVELVCYSIVLREEHSAPLFVHMLKSHICPGTFYRQVKVLCITVLLTNLGILMWANLPKTTQEIDTVTFNALAFSVSPLFQNVTHLQLQVIRPRDFDAKQLHSLKHLTHLSLVYPFYITPAAWLPDLLQRLYLADSIAVCLVFCRLDLEAVTSKSRATTDPRVVFATWPDDVIDEELFEHVLRRDPAQLDDFIGQSRADRRSPPLRVFDEHLIKESCQDQALLMLVGPHSAIQILIRFTELRRQGSGLSFQIHYSTEPSPLVIIGFGNVHALMSQLELFWRNLLNEDHFIQQWGSSGIECTGREQKSVNGKQLRRL
ncbi:hypothetical protein C8J56DRAFT_1166892 [Mycena floridula]|nr:hypothetical protein C8J56DRAFT_1166892 [Mycena floridula]